MSRVKAGGLGVAIDAARMSGPAAGVLSARDSSSGGCGGAGVAAGGSSGAIVQQQTRPGPAARGAAAQQPQLQQSSDAATQSQAGGTPATAAAAAVKEDPLLAAARAAQESRERRALSEHPLKVLVRADQDEAAMQKLFDFHRPLPPSPGERRTCLAVWAHTDGCQFCSALFGHFQLPNGGAAHFYLPPEAAACRGRAVAPAQPPTVPWAEPHQLPACGLPPATTAARAIARAARPGQLPAAGRLLWVPVPLLAPLPRRSVLRGTAAITEAGGLELALMRGPVRLKAVVEVTRVEELRVPVEVHSVRRRRSVGSVVGGVGGAKPVSGAAAATGGAGQRSRAASPAAPRATAASRRGR